MSVYNLPTSSSYTIQDKKVIFNTNSNSQVYNPIDGVVKKISNSDCGGNVKISHNIGGRKFESVFCNIQPSSINVNDKLSSNSIIGVTTNNPLNLKITEGGFKVDPLKYIGINIDSKNSKSKDNDYTRYKDSPPSDAHIGPLSKLLAKGFELPFNVIKNMPILPYKFKESTELAQDKKVLEEINRINDIMKNHL